jgi:6-phosphofructokinase 1
MKRIAVLTSGGDAPGMNAAIRAVVRTAAYKGLEVFGIRRGFSGLIEGEFHILGTRDVSGIIGQGGTILGSARSPEFKTESGQQLALQMLEKQHIDSLIIIGGDGSQKGSWALSQAGFPVIGIASTIDNDLYGSDVAIGVDTALNVALESIDRLKITASSHNRIFIVEVMGRDYGYLALMAGIAGGAEAILIPEIKTDIDQLAANLHEAYAKGKPHAIVVVAEGAQYNAEGLAHYFRTHSKELGFELRTTILGYVQRGGCPGVFDRLLGTRLGAAAVDLIAQGKAGLLTGLTKGEIISLPLKTVAQQKKQLSTDLFELATILAR